MIYYQCLQLSYKRYGGIKMAQYEVQRKAIEQKKSSNSSERTVQLKHNNVASIIQMAKMNPEMLTQNDVMALQKTMGNGAVSQLIKGAGDKHNEIVQKKDGKLEGNESLQMKVDSNIFQRAELPKEEPPVQIKKGNNTGLPDNLKAGVENLSGIDMSDVRVHYNSDKPAGVGALAYTQGTDIHVAPGQEKHLAHEAWHVVQQAQGRVQPTMQMKVGVNVNDDMSLEKEADVLGGKAVNLYSQVDKPQENESGAISNDYVQEKNDEMQGFRFLNNRRKPIQRVEDLDRSDARVLSIIRSVCEEELLNKENITNYEVQVSLDKEGIVTVGYNVGGSNGIPDPKKGTVQNLPKLINDTLYKTLPKLKNIWIKNVKIVKSNIVSPESGRCVHAELMIILTTLQNMMQKIISGEDLKHIDLNIRGKKYTCVNCEQFIKLFDCNLDIRKFLTIHTPTKEIFNQTKEAGDREVTQYNNPIAWENPLRTGLDTTEVKTYLEMRPNDDISRFIDALDQIGRMENPR